MIPVVVESPYAGEVDRNIRYAQRCMIDSLERGEAPLLGHLLYTQVLDDRDEFERARGIGAHMAWLNVAACVAVYQDYGISRGMRAAIDYVEAGLAGPIDVLYRKIGENP